MEYIAYKRFHKKAICGPVNIPALSKCEQIGVFICYKKQPICIATSENAHTFFMRNDDGNGMQRGALITKIQTALKNNQQKWDKVWADATCQKFRRTEHQDHWLWSHSFYIADIADLEYIATLVCS